MSQSRDDVLMPHQLRGRVLDEQIFRWRDGGGLSHFGMRCRGGGRRAYGLVFLGPRRVVFLRTKAALSWGATGVVILRHWGFIPSCRRMAR